MKIDGKLISSQIKIGLKGKVSILKTKNIFPQLAVILVGNDPSSEVYVRQKLKVGEEIGTKVTLYSSNEVRSSRLSASNDKEKLIKLVDKFNRDPLVHGIIIQRPVPLDISKEELDLLVIPQKDVDGFHPKSPYNPPIASAVVKILEWIYTNGKNTPGVAKNDKTPRGWPRLNRGTPPMVEESNKQFFNWLKKQKILVIGRGETAGKPIAQTLEKMGVNIEIAHSKTNNLKKVCLASDIIITCVGKPDVVRLDMINTKTILIGVGLHQESGKLKTDYNQEEIAAKVAYFTPVPGGVGPVNVACLFENLIMASSGSLI